jgi:hypothetical protein
MIAQALVYGIIAAEVALPLALVFWAGRRFERWSQERAVSAGARLWLEHRGQKAGPLEPVGLELQEPPLEARGFPLTRRRRR